ncbi:histone-like nucleoid-structuring protein Lsr2 [Streptomyces antimycoticus]|uniref:Lsr2 family DNA-binding protein n=1 Tax=Streptomyces antimycoticus TaxID=68175 RepID=UPI0034301FDD
MTTSKESTGLDAYTAVVLSMHGDGHSPQEIAEKLGIEIEEVTGLIAAQTADAEASTGQPTPAPEEAVAEAIPELADLLAWAAAHDDQVVRDHGAQASAALAALRERRRVDEELAQITTEATELEKRLADLRARESELRPQPAAGRKKKRDRDYDPREVRHWARENGYTLPDRGQIPKAVRNAWRARFSPQLQAVG